MALNQTFKNGVLISEEYVPDEIPVISLEDKVAALEAEIIKIKKSVGVA